MSTEETTLKYTKDLEKRLRLELIKYLFLAGRRTELNFDRNPLGIPTSMVDHLKDATTDVKEDWKDNPNLAFEWVMKQYKGYLDTTGRAEGSTTEKERVYFRINPNLLDTVETHEKLMAKDYTFKQAKNEYYRQFKPYSVEDVQDIFQVALWAKEQIGKLNKRISVEKVGKRSRITAGEFSSKDVHVNLINVEDGRHILIKGLERSFVTRTNSGLDGLIKSLFPSVYLFKNLGKSKINNVRSLSSAYSPVILSEDGNKLFSSTEAGKVTYTLPNGLEKSLQESLLEYDVEVLGHRVVPRTVFNAFIGATLSNKANIVSVDDGQYDYRWEYDSTTGLGKKVGKVVKNGRKHIVVPDSIQRGLLNKPCPVKREWSYPSYVAVNEKIKLGESTVKLASSRHVLRAADEPSQTYAEVLLAKQPKGELKIRDIIGHLLNKYDDGIEIPRHDRRLMNDKHLEEIWNAISDASNYKFTESKFTNIPDHEEGNLQFQRFSAASLYPLFTVSSDASITLRGESMTVKSAIEYSKSNFAFELKHQVLAYDEYKGRTAIYDPANLMKLYKQLDSYVSARVDKEMKIVILDEADSREAFYKDSIEEGKLTMDAIERTVKDNYENFAFSILEDDEDGRIGFENLRGELETKRGDTIISSATSVGKNISFLEKSYFNGGEEEEVFET